MSHVKPNQETVMPPYPLGTQSPSPPTPAPAAPAPPKAEPGTKQPAPDRSVDDDDATPAASQRPPADS